ncbi:DUF2182 domain-containing protein [Paraburkholderia sp. GAS41]|uniref:DUF2182 domain-containing protein n=1 Tax=Paraburkholderia sp. GAS41 TaxID=3035134 RepID=UPI003D1C8B7C
MSSMGRMPMPGGWTMSLAWTRMCGQTWLDLAVSFLSMWAVMMTAMMLPSLTPVLWRYHESVCRAGAPRPIRLTAMAALAYFQVWTALGMLAFAPGVLLAALEIRWPALARAVPFAVAAIVLGAGAFQFTTWRAYYFACYRTRSACSLMSPATIATAWRYGLRLGLACAGCSASLTAVLLAIGIMDLRAMAAVTAAVTLERLAPAGERVARAIGVVVVGAGLLLLAKAVGLE